jgi:hypothetical protein
VAVSFIETRRVTLWVTRKETAMHPVFQEITEIARVKLREALSQQPETFGGWDADSFEQEVREFSRELGQNSLQPWAEMRLQQAEGAERFVAARLQGVVQEYEDEESFRKENLG